MPPTGWYLFAEKGVETVVQGKKETKNAKGKLKTFEFVTEIAL